MMFDPYPITTVGERQGKQVGHLLYILLFSLRARTISDSQTTLAFSGCEKK